MKATINIVLFFIFLILTVNLVGAATIEYSDNDMKAHIKDKFLFFFTTEKGIFNLTSHQSIDEIKKVETGDQIVLYYDVNYKDIEKNGLGNVTFINMRTKKEIFKDWNYVYWGQKTIQDPIYSCSEELTINGTYEEVCIQNGFKEKVVYDWIDYNSRDIPKGRTIIGVKTNVKPDEWIDTIIEVEENKIVKHAEYSSTLDFGGSESGSGSTTNNYGINITINSSDVVSMDIGLYPSVTASNVFLRSASGGTLIETCPVTNKVATCNTLLNATQSYILMAGNVAGGGSAYTRAFRNTGVSYPYDGELLSVVDGIDNVFGSQPTIIFNIRNITATINITTQIAQLEPIGNYISNSQNVTFIVNVTDTPINVSLIINDTYYQTNTSGILGNYTFLQNLTEGIYEWKAEGCFLGGCVNTSLRNLIVDTTPFIEFVAPTPANNTNLTNTYLPINVSLTETYFNNVTFNFYKEGVLNETITFTNSTRFYNKTNLENGDWIVNVTTCTTTFKCNTTENRYYIVDGIPPLVNVSNPSGEYDYLRVGQLINLTFTVIEEDTVISSCLWDYNGTNYTASICNNATPVNIPFAQEEDNFNITVCANDTFNNWNCSTTTWSYKLLELNQTYNEETLEGSRETFLATIKINPSYTIQNAVILNYNSTNTTGENFPSGDYTILRKTDLLVPNVDTDTNATFYWHVTLSDATEINLSAQNQTIYKLDVDNCSTYTVELYNFTVVDEEKQTILPNATIETAFNFYDALRSEIVFNYSMEFEKVNPLRICINRNITDRTEYSLDVIVRYESSSYANEYYNIVEAEITNESESQKITLYDLNSSDSTEFQLTFTGSDYLPEEGALVYLERQYISENTFKTVELPQTDSNGQTVLHLVRNDVIYNMIIIKDNQILKRALNIIAFCEDYTIGQCTIKLNALGEQEDIFNYDDEVGIIYTSAPEYNATSNDVTFSFTSTDGTEKEVSMYVERRDVFGNNSVCSNTITSISGTLSCDIGYNLTDSTLFTTIYVDNEEWIRDSTPITSSAYGSVGYATWFLMALSIFLMFSKSKNGVLSSIPISYVAGIGLGIGIGGMTGIGSAGIWVLVMTSLGMWQLNKRRRQ